MNVMDWTAVGAPAIAVGSIVFGIIWTIMIVKSHRRIDARVKRNMENHERGGPIE
jgi:hypothetical protein